MSKGLEELRLNHVLCDGTIKTSDGAIFPIHRVILCAFSPYFRAFFTNCLNTGDSEVIEMTIEDFSSEIISPLIEFAYTGTCKISHDNVYTVIIAADRFSCESLISYCTEYLSNTMDASTCLRNLRFSRFYFCHDLEVIILKFLI